MVRESQRALSIALLILDCIPFLNYVTWIPILIVSLIVDKDIKEIFKVYWIVYIIVFFITLLVLYSGNSDIVILLAIPMIIIRVVTIILLFSVKY